MLWGFTNRRAKASQSESVSRITPSSPGRADLSSSAEMSAAVMSSPRYWILPEPHVPLIDPFPFNHLRRLRLIVIRWEQSMRYVGRVDK